MSDQPTHNASAVPIQEVAEDMGKPPHVIRPLIIHIQHHDGTPGETPGRCLLD